MSITFFAPGNPASQGSKDQFGRESCKALPAWRSLVSLAARQAAGDMPPMKCPVEVLACFTFPRPNNHYGTGKNSAVLKTGAPHYKTSKPDIDKILRSILDSMTGILFVDDSCVVVVHAYKMYGENPGVKISVNAI